MPDIVYDDAPPPVAPASPAGPNIVYDDAPAQPHPYMQRLPDEDARIYAARAEDISKQEQLSTLLDVLARRL